jgi:hypothetical protein
VLPLAEFDRACSTPAPLGSGVVENTTGREDWSSHKAELVQQYTDGIDKAIADQRAFVHSSLFAEAGYLHGLTHTDSGLGLTHNRQWGLHIEDSGSAVKEWKRIGAPLDGLWRIHYGDGLEHWETPLLTALVDERIEVADALLAFGANVDAPNCYIAENGTTLAHTALHMMVTRGEKSHVRRLIAAGADVNRRTTDGVSPLSLAASEDLREVTALLLENGADPTLVDFFGRSALDRAGPQTRHLLA